ncbi:alpha/beta hydrolase-fold protein [Winogradskyella sp.]|nr:alpha/beta hydrolase-fold protein [Winogradskyella sp.]MDB9781701.1 alpha/beta hydrolase-fold protein [Winogradskyella sp.]MDC0006447.1 alpha/beta hydrolase-fold protein [Winogradskyella sp.]MDC1503831.1 alpha/beta hydrolase-fold protein [Winogradskyella sp.]
MKKNTLILLTCLLTLPAIAQIRYKEINSSQLNVARQLKIKLPKNYDPSSDLKHPLIIVFDGDYLFEPVAGQVDFQTYFDDMPGSIIVGVVQGEDRYYDGYCDEITGLPKEAGLRFHNFISGELIPYLDNNYNTSKFRVAVGHDLMGNFINSYLFKDKPLFQAYVSISPDLSGNVKDYLGQRLEFFKDDIFYYMATSDNDMPNIRKAVLEADLQISEVKNQFLTYYFDDFKNETHYTLVTSAISRSFDKIFELYKPLREKELEEKVVPYEGTLDNYLVERYDRIEKLFGIKKGIPKAEFQKVIKIAEQRKDLESLEKIGKLAKKLYPESLLGTYYLAQHAEKIGKTKKAKKLYETALTLNEFGAINIDFIYSKIDELDLANLAEDGKNDDKDDKDKDEEEEEDDN